MRQNSCAENAQNLNIDTLLESIQKDEDIIARCADSYGILAKRGIIQNNFDKLTNNNRQAGDS